MTIHTCESRSDYLTEPILADGCDRCAEHATESMLLSLDHEKIMALYSRMLAVERGVENLGATHYLTGNEAEACHQLYRLAVFLERHAGIYPWIPMTEWGP